MSGNQEFARRDAASLGWWAISGESLMAMLREASAGADPDVLYAEHYANSEHPCSECGGTGRVGVSYTTDYGTGTEWDWVECPNGCPEKLHMVSGELHDDVLGECNRLHVQVAKLEGEAAVLRDALALLREVPHLTIGSYDEWRDRVDEYLARPSETRP